MFKCHKNFFYVKTFLFLVATSFSYKIVFILHPKIWTCNEIVVVIKINKTLFPKCTSCVHCTLNDTYNDMKVTCTYKDDLKNPKYGLRRLENPFFGHSLRRNQSYFCNVWILVRFIFCCFSSGAWVFLALSKALPEEKQQNFRRLSFHFFVRLSNQSIIVYFRVKVRYNTLFSDFETQFLAFKHILF